VTEETKKEMKKILGEIQDGVFAKEWMLSARRTSPLSMPLQRKARGIRLRK